jgi:hypothetical protein
VLYYLNIRLIAEGNIKWPLSTAHQVHAVPNKSFEDPVGHTTSVASIYQNLHPPCYTWYNAMVGNEWSYTSTPSCVFMACTGTGLRLLCSYSVVVTYCRNLKNVMIGVSCLCQVP